MATPLSPQDGESLPTRRARVESIDLFEVKREELDLIETGLQNTPINLAFASFLASTTLTCIATLFTSSVFKWEWANLLFILIAFFSFIFAFYFFILWRRNRSSDTRLISTIRDRMKNGNGDSSSDSDKEDLPA